MSVWKNLQQKAHILLQKLYQKQRQQQFKNMKSNDFDILISIQTKFTTKRIIDR